jgi:predicted dehydrogenase
MIDSRRSFFIKSAKIGLGASIFSGMPLSAISSMRKYVSPNEKINFGLIGCKGMGWADMKSILKNSETDCIAICDVDENVLNNRSNNVEEVTGKKPLLYGDYREMLENKDIDAVVIGTPDHWHCLNLVDSLEAEKHAYCEKPISNSIAEANIMLKSAKKHNKCVQIGQWQRSGSQYKEALDYLWSGKLGDIRLVKVWAYQGWYGWVDNKPDTNPPHGVNYNMWLGPAPMRKFNQNRFHFNFRWYWDYAGGLMTDWGVHEIDIALYGMKAKDPISIMASGGKFGYPNQDTETPDTLQTIYKYDNFTMLWEHANGIDGGNYGKGEGIAFIGNNGTLVVNRGGWEVIPERDHRNGGNFHIEKIPKQSVDFNALDAHTKNFIDCIKNNDPNSLNCGIESGSIAAINAHMGNIAYKTGNKIYWNKERGNFGYDYKANSLITPKYNNGWKLPKI